MAGRMTNCIQIKQIILLITYRQHDKHDNT